MSRQKMYNREERRAMWDHACKLEAQAKAMKKSRVREKMPEQNPKLRIQNFSEVALGYTHDNALREASRCLQCKNSPCVEGCPVNVQIPAFIKKPSSVDDTSPKTHPAISAPAIYLSILAISICKSRLTIPARLWFALSI